MKAQDRFSRKQLRKIHGTWERAARHILGVTFNEYLEGNDSTQSIPNPPLAGGDRLERQIFVDGRLIERVGLNEVCRLLKIVHQGSDDRYIASNPDLVESGVRWMQYNDGRQNRGRAPVDYRRNCPAGGAWLDVYEGIFAYLDNPRAFSDHSIYLLGSLRREHTEIVGWIGNIFGYQPKLSWYYEYHTNPDFGAAWKRTG